MLTNKIFNASALEEEGLGEKVEPSLERGTG